MKYLVLLLFSLFLYSCSSLDINYDPYYYPYNEARHIIVYRPYYPLYYNQPTYYNIGRRNYNINRTIRRVTPQRSSHVKSSIRNRRN